jgi:replication-associated recombination protein RarA
MFCTNLSKVKKIGSMILWGPPGVGKTTLARIIAENMSLPFFALSAIAAGVREVRENNSAKYFCWKIAFIY